MRVNRFYKGLNAFGHPVFSPLQIFTQPHEELKGKIRRDVCKYLFSDRRNYFDFIESVCNEGNQLLEAGSSLEYTEEFVERKLFFNHKHDSFVNDRLRDRCERVAKQIIKALELNQANVSLKTLLDVGCGSGLIAKILKNKLSIEYGLLTDVVDYRYKEVASDKSLRFEYFSYPFNKIKNKEKCDLCIIINVLHHTDTPFRVFKAALNCVRKGGIIVVVESCIGLSMETITNKNYKPHKLPFQNVYSKSRTINEITKEYLLLSASDKMLYGIFFDWLYNRVFLNENVNVPYNFGTPIQWEEFFENECNLDSVNTYLLGLDQPSALEFHTLHLLKIKQ